ncbi:hypothetical protein BDF20DRAFT_855228 [Mycotypha africana]|uniref:uncharacterized protein n=1 Tax=Mycotypha africana TaxID=64632 RepID=UPI00230065A1|nr:uncharacterized protein BDF20DRAFT_855228 [Mycotypha africana]KAI8988346.1 hypothetical protein BDF20DRAFT_855228 [Mycotypha africana]
MASAVLMSTSPTPTECTLRDDNKSISIYDSLPILDVWYSNKHDDLDKQLKQKHQDILRRHLESQNKRRKTACIQSVSFSAEPPLVHHYEHEPSKNTHSPSKTPQRPQHSHKRSNSSSDFKEFIRHCTSKLSRQLSSGSSSHSATVPVAVDATAKKAHHRRSA